MSRLTFKAFYKTAPAPKRMMMSAVGAFAALVVISSLCSISMILRRKGNEAAAQYPRPVRTPAALTEIPPYTFRFELPNFSISLPSKKGGRTAYAQFSLVLDCPTLASRRHLELNRARLRDTLLTASMPFGEQDLKGNQGISRYKSRLLVELRGAFGPNAPRDLSLENFLVH